MTAFALVVPTRGDRPFLPEIIAAAGCPVVVVVTSEVGVDLIADLDRPDVCLAYDRGPVNIQRWWNLGIDVTASIEAEHVAICNDDITLAPGLLRAMSERLDETGASICYPFSEHSVGWCFMLNLPHGLRPDERFRWYYGDNDLHEQALRLHGVCDVGMDVPHHCAGESEAAFADLIAADAQAFREKWQGR